MPWLLYSVIIIVLPVEYYSININKKKFSIPKKQKATLTDDHPLK